MLDVAPLLAVAEVVRLSSEQAWHGQREEEEVSQTDNNCHQQTQNNRHQRLLLSRRCWIAIAQQRRIKTCDQHTCIATMVCELPTHHHFFYLLPLCFHPTLVWGTISLFAVSPPRSPEHANSAQREIAATLRSCCRRAHRFQIYPLRPSTTADP